MEKKYEYVEISTGEKVEDYMASDYALDKLGITVTPRGKNGEMTLEQMEYIETITDWYFSGNWVKEEIKEDEGDIFELIDEECAMEDYIENDENEFDLEKIAVMSDMLYDEEKDKRMGLI